VAGLIKVWQGGKLDLHGRVVCTLTGHGLKDPERAIATAVQPVEADPTRDAVLREIEAP
jgi:threonine synthase